jgi:hypothetical protein
MENAARSEMGSGPVIKVKAALRQDAGSNPEIRRFSVRMGPNGDLFSTLLANVRSVFKIANGDNCLLFWKGK